MLPFTKRPNKAEDSDVVTKDDLVAPSSPSPGSIPPSAVKRSTPPPASASSMLQRPQSVADDELTGILQSRSMTGPILPAAGRPAAGSPASRRAPPSVRPNSGPPSSMRPPPSSMRPAPQDDEDAEDDDDGRTVVRGAPKIVKRTNAKSKRNASSSQPPTSISPAAVIKATLESSRANRRDGNGLIMPGPPADLLEDRDDFTDNERETGHHVAARAARSAYRPAHWDNNNNSGGNNSNSNNNNRDNQYPFEGPPSHRPPPMGAEGFGGRTHGMEGPPSYRPPPSSPNPMFSTGPQLPPSSNVNPYGATQPMQQHQQQQQQQQQQPASYAPPASSVPGTAASMPAHFMKPQAPYAADPPGTAVTSGHRIAGRPAVSWAAALLAFGLFVGVAAVAVIQSSDSAAETTASFVDPARTPAAKQNGPEQASPTTATTPMPVNGVAGRVPAIADPNGAPPGLIGASPVQPAPPPDPNLAVAPVVATPAQPGIAFAPVPVAPSNTAKPKFSGWKPPPAPAKKPTTTTASNDDDEKPKKPAAGKTKPSGEKSSGADDETKKALEALQKAQLESSF